MLAVRILSLNEVAMLLMALYGGWLFVHLLKGVGRRDKSDGE